MTDDRTAADRPLELAGKHAHFVGIGGCGMSGLARIVAERGARVSGSDMAPTAVTDALVAEGLDVVFAQTAANVPADCDLLVCSAAIRPEHPQRVEAARRGIPVYKYAQLLGRLMIGRTGVAIAGTHGKSTTTAMLAHALIEAGCDPSFIVGATCAQIGGGARVGRPEVLIAEACEYDRSFHNFRPTHSVVLNVEEDHLDIYRTLDGVVEAFNHFARLTAPDGSLLIAHDSACRSNVAAGAACPIQTIGFAPQAHWRIDTQRADGAQHVRVFEHDAPRCEFHLKMPGEHMAYNAAAAAVTAHRLGAGWAAIGNALSNFRGLDRRMQVLGTVSGVTVIDDYGHHPTEIDTTLRALRQHYLEGGRGKWEVGSGKLEVGSGKWEVGSWKWEVGSGKLEVGSGKLEVGGGKLQAGDLSRAAVPTSDFRPPTSLGRLICVFQPHQHSRTRFLLEQFATSFSAADIVIVPPIYFVRDSEQDKRAVSAADLVAKLQGRGVIAEHIAAFDDIVSHLKRITRPGDLLVIMGAGPVWQIGHKFAGRTGKVITTTDG